MESNAYITNKIPISGTGIHKTYEESYFYVIHKDNFYQVCNNSQRGLYMCEEGLTWINKKEMEDGTLPNVILNHPEYYIKVTILSINPINDDNWYMLELIDSSILHRHLMSEANKKESEKTLKL